MHVIAAVDSFKGSMTSLQAGQAVKRGILSSIPDADVVIKPVADGGEGTVTSLTEGMQGETIRLSVTGPMGDPVVAQYGILADQVAVLEMAQAAGLPLVPEEKRNPLLMTTYGVGEMILDALDRGCRRFIIGIGGSATNDGGTGMLSALGFRFEKEDGSCIAENATELDQIMRIDPAMADPRLAECEFQIACDVTNPLCGENGASAVFAPQKGADEIMVKRLDQGLAHYAQKTAESLRRDDRNVPGAGAAGGLGFAFVAYLHAKLVSGVDLILDTVLDERELDWADVIVTGEGQLDAQTGMGKAPYGIAKRGKEHGCLVLALAGSVTTSEKSPYLDAVFSIQQGPVSLKEAMQTEAACKNMELTSRQVFGLLKYMDRRQNSENRRNRSEKNHCR